MSYPQQNDKGFLVRKGIKDGAAAACLKISQELNPYPDQ
jgi:hypothetical protein